MALWMETGSEPTTQSEKDDLEAIEALKHSTALELKVSLSLSSYVCVCVCVCVNNLIRSKFWGPISVFCLSNQHGL